MLEPKAEEQPVGVKCLICLKHTLRVSACVIAYELKFQQRGEQEHRGEGTGAISAGAGEVKRCGKAAAKTRVAARALAATAVRSQGSKAAGGKASTKGNIFKGERVNGSYSSQEERRPILRRLQPRWS